MYNINSNLVIGSFFFSSIGSMIRHRSDNSYKTESFLFNSDPSVSLKCHGENNFPVAVLRHNQTILFTALVILLLLY